MKLLSRNLLALALPAIFSLLLSLIFNHFTTLPSEHWYLGAAFLLVLGFVLNTVYARRAGKPDFTQLLLVALVVKLLLCLIVIVVYLLLTDKARFFNFSVQFILHFVLFTSFEIGYLRHIIKNYPLKLQ